MYFRSQRKLQGELSLSDSLDGDGENGSLSLIDVVRVDDNMLEELDLRDACAKVRRCVDACLTGREAHIIRLRYGLGERPPPHPEGNRIAVRNQPELCIPPRLL